MTETVLITGGAGFIGSHLAGAIVQKGGRVVAYDNLFTGCPENLIEFKGQVKLVHGDILDLSFLIRTMMSERVTRIIHTAALVSYDPSIEKPALTAKINIEGTINVLEAARIVGVGRVMDVGSEQAYGEFQKDPADEDHPLSPTVPYAITKMAAEKYEEFYHRQFGLDVVIVRTSWVYGPGLPRQRAPKTMIENSLKGLPTTMESGADQRTDHTYIDDFIQGALLALEAETLEKRVFHIASGKAYTYDEMARMVEQIIPGPKISVGPGLLRQSTLVEGQQKGALDIRRAQSELGYQPQYDLYDGLVKYTEALKSKS
jgi:UDP-glucose 4-epimerase